MPNSKIPAIFSRIFLVFLTIILCWPFIAISTRFIQGVIILVHGLICIALGLGVLYSLRKQGSLFAQKVTWLFPLPFIIWGASEFVWAGSYFFFNLESRFNFLVLASCGYPISFILASFAFLLCLKRPFFNASSWRIIGFSLAVSTPMIARIIFNPFIDNIKTDLFTPFFFSELIAISGAYLLLNISIVVLLSTREVSWSLLSSGFISLVFGDLAIRVDKILGTQVQMGAPSIAVMFGLYSAALALIIGKPNTKIENFDGTSLFSNYKLGTLSIVLFSLGVFALSQSGSLESIKIICLGCSLGAFASVSLSYFITSKIKNFSEKTGAILKMEVGELSPQSKAELVSELPLELRDSYENIFSAIIKNLKFLAKEREILRLQRFQAQIAHDIRSPLAALSVISQDLYRLPEDSRILVRESINRINDIANLLLIENRNYQSGQTDFDPTKNTTKQNDLKTILLSSLLDTIVTEKRMQNRSKLNLRIETQIDENGYGLFAKVDEIELKRVISNIVNNSVDALVNEGTVQLQLQGNRDFVSILIRDNGPGVPPEVLAQLGTPGNTFGKPTGNGLGLFHALSAVESWGGKLNINSQLGEGAQVDIQLPRSSHPTWFVPSLKLSSTQKTTHSGRRHFDSSGLGKTVRCVSKQWHLPAYSPFFYWRRTQKLAF